MQSINHSPSRLAVRAIARKTSTLRKLIKELGRYQGARFISLLYKAKGTGELARHTLLLGVNLGKAYKRDLAFYRGKLAWLTRGMAQDDARRLSPQVQACQELVDSFKESLTKGIGNNSRYTCKGVYLNTALPSVKVHIDKGELHLTGFTRGKVILEAGTYPTVKSSPKTIAKDLLRKGARTGYFRQYVLNPDNLQKVALNGNVLTIG